jgi:hypothetical protein
MPDNQLQRLSPAYRLPASDPDFILSDSMQGVRFLLEFAKADERLRLWGIRTTIVVLGSARIRGKQQRPWTRKPPGRNWPPP